MVMKSKYTEAIQCVEVLILCPNCNKKTFDLVVTKKLHGTSVTSCAHCEEGIEYDFDTEVKSLSE